LTEQDRDNIRVFRLRFLSKMPCSTYNLMRSTFRSQIHITSEWVLLRRIALLSGIEPVRYDCCTNCICYLGKYTDMDSCPYCGEGRYRDGDSAHKARRHFCYIPLIPRLQAYFRSMDMIDLLGYRSERDQEGNPDIISDIFDGEHYQNLRHTPVVIDGQEQAYNHFSEDTDLAFASCSDGYLIFWRKHGGPSATPLLLQNLSLPPSIRTHLEHLLCVGIIPGPHAPKDMATPLEEEFVQLAHGVKTFHVSKKHHFDLRAYRILEEGDILAIEKVLNLKGHNSKTPCRSCMIKAFRHPQQTNYYPALHSPLVEGEDVQSWDSLDLPLRTHDSYLEGVAAVETANEESKAAGLRMNQWWGIWGPPAIGRVGSLDYARSFPWDWMHLFGQNIIPNFIRLWTGCFKGLDAGMEDYIFADSIWQAIGQETEDAVQYIPSAFVRKIGNIALDRSGMTAESYVFWFMYMAPSLLANCFKHRKYYDHYMELVEIMKYTLKYRYSRAYVTGSLRKKIAQWVQKYENRLAVCVMPIHGLLHLVDDFLFCGPGWTTWTFFMERFCGILKDSLRSKSQPWSNLNNRAIQLAYLSKLAMLYSVDEEIEGVDRGIVLSQGERISVSYSDPYTILCPPCVSQFGLDSDGDLRKKIAQYFLEVLNFNRKKPITLAQIRAKLPGTVMRWGKVRTTDGSMSIRSAIASRVFISGGIRERDSSYVRYTLSVPSNKRARQRGGGDGEADTVLQVFYGRLVYAIACSLPNETFWGSMAGTTKLLALIEMCHTEGKDARRGVVFYDRTSGPNITDIQTIEGVVGRMKCGQKWAIVEKARDEVQTIFENGIREYPDGNGSDVEYDSD
ncbi:hypothetical protein PUNSTDRAFT_62011, partial [Punctularia strigosozonata HHB-11173 SS5]|uniref:uncharacterized protein n=1 Tax=Punctularia strigosozonata (strain HHB-11173) TaxID=741275 RepID=UPI00044178B6